MQHSSMKWLGNMEIGLTQLLVCYPKITCPVLFVRGLKELFFSRAMSAYISGYKLAFNYLKAKRHVDAIDVCHKVRHLDIYSLGDDICVLSSCESSLLLSTGSGCSSQLSKNEKGHPWQSSRCPEILVLELCTCVCVCERERERERDEASGSVTLIESSFIVWLLLSSYTVCYFFGENPWNTFFCNFVFSIWIVGCW